MLSAVVVARNEAERIGRCLDSLRFADEVLVLDGGSTDATCEVARAHGARVEVHPFSDFSSQRRHAASLALHPWVLSVDADEEITPELAQEIRAAAESPGPVAWRIPTLDYMFGKWIRHGGWYPQYHIRLFQKKRGSWQGAVHEAWRADGPVGTLRHPILHRSHLEVSDFIAKLNRYTSVAAAERHRAGERVSFARLVFEPPAYFAYKYLWQRGFLDGAHGWVLASLLSWYRMTELAKIRFHGSREGAEGR